MDFGNDCVAPNVGTGDSGLYLRRGLNTATVSGLTPYTTYSCYVATVLPAGVGAVCSQPTFIYTNVTA